MWIGKTSRFYYRVTIKGGHEFVMVDATTQQKQPAFDHARLAAALTKVSGTDKPYIPTRLPFNVFTFTEDEKSIDVSIERARWMLHARRLHLQAAGLELPRAVRRTPSRPRRGLARTGSGAASDQREGVARWRVGSDRRELQRDRPPGQGRGARASRIVLSTDGSEGNYYDMRSLAWSPDSQKIAIHRVRPGYRRLVHYIESSPEDQLQPKHSTLLYAKPGDVVDLEQPVIFDVASKAQIAVAERPVPESVHAVAIRCGARTAAR